MRVSCLLATVSICLIGRIAHAAPTVFPYEAVVQSDGVTVRSGPGERYDPTMKLSSGQRVTVYRHDPGGWYMIAPPPGSFSWINAEYVETTGNGRGVVKAPVQGNGFPARVPVWVGSEFTTEHNTTARQLASGDEVTIIGEEIHSTREGTAKFYKIEPPRLEHRFIKGDSVIPLSELDQAATISPVKPLPLETAEDDKDDPFAGPSFASQSQSTTPSPPGFPVEREPIQRETKLLERELDRAVDTHAVAKSGPDAAELERLRKELFALDDRLEAMLAQGPGEWNLDEMEQAYRDLQSSATPGIAGMIDARLDAIESRRAIKKEYDAFVAIINRTDQRDAELLSLQNASINGIPVGPSAVQLGPPQPTDVPQTPAAVAQPAPPTAPTPLPTGSRPPATLSPPTTDVDVNNLDGAGIITRLPIPRPGVPQHILVAPDGRLLAYLQADPGVNLDAHLGRPVGVVGRRFQDARLRSDVIIVRQLTPVQLQP